MSVADTMRRFIAIEHGEAPVWCSCGRKFQQEGALDVAGRLPRHFKRAPRRICTGYALNSPPEGVK